MPLNLGGVRKPDEEIPVGASDPREASEVRNRLWERWREWGERGSVLHLIFLLLLLITPSVAGALWSPIWGVLLGIVALVFWLMFGCLCYRGNAGCFYFIAGWIGIVLQIQHQLTLARQLLTHAG